MGEKVTKVGAQKHVQVDPESNVAKRLREQQRIMDELDGKKEATKTVGTTPPK